MARYSALYGRKQAEKKNEEDETISVKRKLLIVILIAILEIGVLLLGLGCIEYTKKNTKIISIYVEELPYGIDPSNLNALREAESFWEKRAGVSFKEASNRKDADVTVSWVKEFGGKRIGHAIHKDYVEIGLGDSNCLGKWKPYQYASVLQISMHELGHVLDYDDDYTDSKSVMYYSLTASYETDVEETNILAANTAVFYPVCTKQPIAEYSFEVTAEKPLYVFVLPLGQENSFLTGNNFLYKSLCKGGVLSTYKETCPVSSESVLALKSTSTVRYTVRIKEEQHQITW